MNGDRLKTLLELDLVNVMPARTSRTAWEIAYLALDPLMLRGQLVHIALVTNQPPTPVGTGPRLKKMNRGYYRTIGHTLLAGGSVFKPQLLRLRPYQQGQDHEAVTRVNVCLNSRGFSLLCRSFPPQLLQGQPLSLSLSLSLALARAVLIINVYMYLYHHIQAHHCTCKYLYSSPTPVSGPTDPVLPEAPVVKAQRLAHT